VNRNWLRRIARKAGFGRADAAAFSEREFQSLKEMVFFPRDGADAVERFTREFTTYLGVRHGVAVNSGTSALEIAVAASRIGPGDEVIVPSYSYYSTASAVFKAGARPVFVDVRLDDGCIDPERIRAALTPRTKAIIAVHLAGVPASLDEILEICRAHALLLIEDVAQGVGSEWRGRKLGSFGSLACFSFQASKNLAAGEGGFIATNDERLYPVCSALANVGLMPDGDATEHVLLGGNYRMPYLEAALLSILLARIDAPIDRREENAVFLTESLEAIPGIIAPVRRKEATRINYHFYGFRCDTARPGALRGSELVAALRRAGVPCQGGYPRPLYAHPAFDETAAALSRHPASERGVPARPDPNDHPNTVTLCRDAVGFEQGFLLGTRDDMQRAIRGLETILRRP
jgi:dTDP-4-amino-4,6-dideoxygalactose transaminase